MRTSTKQATKKNVDRYRLELFQIGLRVWPLLGVSRLVRVPQSNRNGVVHCDSTTCVSHTIKFSDANYRTSPFTVYCATRIPGIVSEPRSNIDNEAPQGQRRRIHTSGGEEVVFSFTPRRGQTYNTECDIFKPIDPGNRVMRLKLPERAEISTYALVLDLSKYLAAGYYIDRPRCEYEADKTEATNGKVIRPRNLPAVEKGPGIWRWQIHDVFRGTVRLTWETERRDLATAPSIVNLAKLDRELSINTRLTQDLHNFVRICHYFAAGCRSLNKIGHEMITHRQILNRSLEAIEEVIGAEVIHRAERKGLMLITPAGEAVLDWWSQFYIRWTPISDDLVEAH